MILGEHFVQGLLGFILQASESASTRDPTPTPSSHLQAAFPPTGPSGHARGHLSRGHGAASHRPVCAWGPQRPAGDRRGCPTPPGEDVPRPPPPWEEGARGGEDESSHVVRRGKQESGLLSRDGGRSRALHPRVLVRLAGSPLPGPQTVQTQL